MSLNVDDATRARLFKYIAIAQGNNKCWQWTGGMSGKSPKWLPYKSGLSCNAAKAVYQLVKGEVPENMKLTRICGNFRCVSPHHALTDTERFWSKVDKTSDPSGCWLWLDHIKAGGYGEYRNGKKKIVAHRFAYEITKGKIPEGLVLLHSCDVRSCVNPAHLLVGTALDNQRDMTVKGRGRVGTRNGAAKLTDKDVMAIRELLAQGITQETVAKQFGVVQTTISQIALGKKWKHVK